MSINPSSLSILYGFGIGNLLIVIAAVSLKLKRERVREHSGRKARQIKPLFLELKNELLEIHKIMRMMEELDPDQVPPKTIFDLTLALEETFSCIHNSALAENEAPRRISMRIQIGAKELTAEVTYDGKAADPLLAVPALNMDRPLEEITLDGLEMHIIRKMVDDLRYEWRQERNVLLLTKHFEVGE